MGRRRRGETLGFGLVLASYVVRLVPEELTHGRFVGEVEDVATGVHQAIRDVSELVRFCVDHPPAADTDDLRRSL